jgi:hypothetical protein
MTNKLRLAALAVAIVAGGASFAAAQDYRYGDRDDRYYDRDDNRYDNRYYDRDDNFRRGQHVARETGFRDGADMAREDMWKNKRFNPKPRGRYDDLDRGYRHEFGSKSDYSYRYDEAYREGYAHTFRERGYYR